MRTKTGAIQTEEFDLVVLSVGLIAHPASKELAEVTGIATNRWGFAETPPFELVSTSREGIFTCGAFQSPKDIPDSVAQASAAAAGATRLLAEGRGTLMTRAEYPPERPVEGVEPRIGVFVCHCGINIAGTVDVPGVVEFARTLPQRGLCRRFYLHLLHRLPGKRAAEDRVRKPQPYCGGRLQPPDP